MIKALIIKVVLLTVLNFSSPTTIDDTAAVFGPVKPQAVVLMYHDISEHPSTQITITPEHFSQHLDIITSKGYTVIPIDQYTEYLDGKADIPFKSVIITFDDGYESFYHYAYPELLKRQMTASVFVVVGNVGKAAGSIPCLTWDEMKEMQANGMSFYPHTFDSHNLAAVYGKKGKHPCLAGRNWLPDKQRFERESEFAERVTSDLKKSRQLMENQLGKPMGSFAWPYGQDSARALKIARYLGFKYFFYVENRRLASYNSYHCIPRLNAGKVNVPAESLPEKMDYFIETQIISGRASSSMILNAFYSLIRNS